MKTSEFIRNAALEKCDGALFLKSGALITSYLGWIFYAHDAPPPETKAVWGDWSVNASSPALGATA